jgi:hypothetical protein
MKGKVHLHGNNGYPNVPLSIFFKITSQIFYCPVGGWYRRLCLRLRLHWSQNRHNTTQQSGQTPDKEVEIKNITVYVSCYTETDTTGMLSPPTVWRQQSEYVSSRQSGQMLAAVRVGFECRCNGQNVCQLKCSHTFLQCTPRQMLVCCVVSVLTSM